MQTFLPSPLFQVCAEQLDFKRLNSQINESYIIYQTALGLQDGWKNHPIVKAWVGYADALACYHDICFKEFEKRGGKNKVRFLLINSLNQNDFLMPKWLGDERLHSSHRAALLCKKFEHYSEFGWIEKPEINYWWPPPSCE